MQLPGSAGHANHCARRTDELLGIEVQQRRGRAWVSGNALPVPVLRRAMPGPLVGRERHDFAERGWLHRRQGRGRVCQ